MDSKHHTYSHNVEMVVSLYTVVQVEVVHKLPEGESANGRGLQTMAVSRESTKDLTQQNPEEEISELRSTNRQRPSDVGLQDRQQLKQATTGAFLISQKLLDI